jgi:hypothetical protein
MWLFLELTVPVMAAVVGFELVVVVVIAVATVVVVMVADIVRGNYLSQF